MTIVAWPTSCRGLQTEAVASFAVSGRGHIHGTPPPQRANRPKNKPNKYADWGMGDCGNNGGPPADEQALIRLPLSTASGHMEDPELLTQLVVFKIVPFPLFFQVAMADDCRLRRIQEPGYGCGE